MTSAQIKTNFDVSLKIFERAEDCSTAILKQRNFSDFTCYFQSFYGHILLEFLHNLVECKKKCLTSYFLTTSLSQKRNQNNSVY